MPKGFISREPAEDYFSSTGVSASQVRLYLKSPHLYHQQVVERVPAKATSVAQQYGQLLHLWHERGPTAFWSAVVRAPASVCTAGGQWGAKSKEWLDDQPDDAIPMCVSDHAQLRDQTAEIYENTAARDLILKSDIREFVVRWNWADGTEMRSRIDGRSGGIAYDLKTTRETDPLNTWWKAVHSYRYDIQSVIYSAAMESIGYEAKPILFLVTSTVPPYPCHVVRLPESVLQGARALVDKVLIGIKQRTEWGNWYPDDYGTVTELRCPSFLNHTAFTEE